ncbi:polysaccharide pyruvyl transferase family protein [Tautonia rosea]|uniref:polysaccharide pyruvyl transferase family protein n=1 Tax=Tautonia rosea TaxID=2728037 RepID=UPI001472C4DE|nr:polysaccharide pyruvyl transferase family protein [Tautonia rosea]
MNVYFINDTSDNANWGCRATTRALRELVEEAGGQISGQLGLSKMSRPSRYVPSSAARAFERMSWGTARRLPIARREAVGLVNRTVIGGLDRLYGASDIVPETVDQFDRFANLALDGQIYEPERAGIEQSDVVVINGEGSIYDRQRKGRMMLFLAYVAKKYLNKPCLLVNHTADLHDPIMADMAALVYPILDDVVFREPISAETCRTIVPDAMERIAPDAAFRYRPAERSAWVSLASRPGYFSVWPDNADGFDPSQPYVCVGGSSIYLRPDRPEYDPLPAFNNLCLRLQEGFGQVVLTAPCVQDERFMRPLAKALGLPLIGLHTPTQQAVDILGNAALYISGRWHPSILASTGGTPIIVMTANTLKTTGLLRLLGLDAPVFDSLRLHEQLDAIIDLAHRYVGQGDSLRKELMARVDDLTARVPRNVEWLSHRVVPEATADSERLLVK